MLNVHRMESLINWASIESSGWTLKAYQKNVLVGNQFPPGKSMYRKFSIQEKNETQSLSFQQVTFLGGYRTWNLIMVRFFFILKWMHLKQKFNEYEFMTSLWHMYFQHGACQKRRFKVIFCIFWWNRPQGFQQGWSLPY